MCLAQHHRGPTLCLALMLNSYLGICPPQWEGQLQPFSPPTSSLSATFTGHSDMSCLSIGSFESKNYIYYLDIAWGCARCQGSWRGSSESCRKGSSWRKSREWGKSDEGRNGDLRGSELRRKAQEKNESQAMWTVEFSEVMSPLWPSFLKPWSSRFGAT